MTDDLVQRLREVGRDGTWGETKAEYAAKLRAALDALGFEIKEKSK